MASALTAEREGRALAEAAWSGDMKTIMAAFRDKSPTITRGDEEPPSLLASVPRNLPIELRLPLCKTAGRTRVDVRFLRHADH
ncbi:hypothetical protein BV898_09906 [Hypsibius exemplaris]|uniref:Uncharacterized protein n=1 Tax=Hypsibius exemplaris TaxID=2072580 RepID=A0A1W0WL90_HYPEX|nr:hypothetical protein BV898_09906 [Hypsibius exemplaris]